MAADIITLASEAGKRIVWLRDPTGYAWLREAIVTSPKLERYSLAWSEVIGYVCGCSETQKKLGKTCRSTRVFYLSHRRGPKYLDGLCEFSPDEYGGVPVAVRSIRPGQFSKPPEGLFLVTPEILAAAEAHRAAAFDHWRAWAANNKSPVPDAELPEPAIPWYRRLLPAALSR